MYTDGETRHRVKFDPDLMKQKEGPLHSSTNHEEPKFDDTVGGDLSTHSLTHIFSLYISKLNPRTDLKAALFFQPLQLTNPSTADVWFKVYPIGINKLSTFMSRLLGGEFTNHSQRVTIINRLLDAGFSAADIAKRTGHKSATTILQYRRKGETDGVQNKISKVLDAPAGPSLNYTPPITADGKMSAELREALEWLKNDANLKEVETENLEEPDVECVTDPNLVKVFVADKAVNTALSLGRALKMTMKVFQSDEFKIVDNVIPSRNDKCCNTQLCFTPKSEVQFSINTV